MAKDEYCKIGQPKEGSSAIYDSMKFLSMKREKSMNNEGGSYLKREKSNSLLKSKPNNSKNIVTENKLELGAQDIVNERIDNYFSNKAFIARSQNQPRQGNLNEDISMQNLL